MTLGIYHKYLDERNRLLDRISRLLDDDPRVKAAWLIGSLGRDGGDELSDIDVWVVIDDRDISEIIKDPRQYTSQIGQPVLVVEAPQNAPAGGAYLMSGYDAQIAPHLVDWYWQPLSSAYVPNQVRILFDKQGLAHVSLPIYFTGQAGDVNIIERPVQFISYFWMMLMITAKMAARTRWAEKMELLPTLLAPLAKAEDYIGQPHFRVLNDIPGQQRPDEKIQLLYSLADQMKNLMAILSKQGEEVPSIIIPGAYRYLDMVASAGKVLIAKH
jgi:predicted nucleotidyltransferase